MHTLCVESWFYPVDPKAMAQDPRGRIGLRFVLGILCPQTILLFTALRRDAKAPWLRGAIQIHAMALKRVRKVRCYSASRRLFVPSFCVFIILAFWSSHRPCQPPAKRTPACVCDVTTPITLPGFEVSGDAGMDNLKGPFGKGLHPLYSNAALVRQHRGRISRSSPEGAQDARGISPQPSSAALRPSSPQASHRSLPRKRES